ncbi:MAG: DUF4097 family beta strand repeat-containing protein [Terriglobales bacterium]
MQRTTVVGLVLATCLASAAIAETRKEYRFTVGPKANVSVDTQYGAITVKPGGPSQVIVVAVLQSDKVEVDHSQKGSRVEIESHLLSGADRQSGRVDYEVTIPPDANVNLHSTTGPLTAERLRGDLTFEGAAAPVEVRNVSNGHVHIKTISGPITLTALHAAHVEITSISGDVHLNSVTGPLVQVNSGSGKIFFDGDFGSGGDYNFMTSTGDIEALVPASASADFRAHSMHGQVQKDFPLEPEQHIRTSEIGSSFFGTVGKAASRVVFRSLGGKIRLKLR